MRFVAIESGNCGLASSTDVRTVDDGRGLIVNNKGEEDSEGINTGTLAGLLISLDVPDSTIAKMESTRALDGIQIDEFNGITIQWSYHPDSGRDLDLQSVDNELRY